MPSLPLDFAPNGYRTGFRLHRFEVLNWGTFDRHIWDIEPGGNNALLTGDIGSGKTTLVDGLTTLLVPPQKITYNKAAGSEGRERNLTSYARGYYKREKDDADLSPKDVALRDQHSYSVLLGYFYNEGFDQQVTLAQVFWFQDNKSTPERLYVVANQILSIAEDFSQFGTDIRVLRKRLRDRSGVIVFNSFTQYGAEFRRRMGLASEQALELFYQTVSMKSVGNLTAFVRQHMLQETPVGARVEAMCRAFDNLNQAHEAVLKAKDQIQTLAPLVADCQRYRDQQVNIDDLRHCRDGLSGYFAQHKVELLRSRIDRREQELVVLEVEMEQDKQTLTHLRKQAVDIGRSIDDNGGRRLEDLRRDIARLTQERQKTALLAEDYGAYCQALELPQPESPETFYANRQQAEQKQHQAEAEKRELERQRVNAQIKLQELKSQCDEIEQELVSLRQRKSNIPLSNLRLRQQLCDTLDLSTEALPFVGELVQVHEAADAWEGAIERLLHSVGLSLLVPQEHYLPVARYVDRTHLQGRLVYYRVQEGRSNRANLAEPNTLVSKLSIKPDSPFYRWLEDEFSQRFNHVCCDTLEEFQRQPKAITREGQIKSNGRRHEKDDRYRLDDRSRYILGWQNQDKIVALETQLQQLQQQGQSCAATIEDLQRDSRIWDATRDQARDLCRISEFSDIHWQPLALRIQHLTEEQQRIEQGSDILRTLQAQLDQTVQEIAAAETRSHKTLQAHGALASQLKADQTLLEETTSLLDTVTDEHRALGFSQLTEIRTQVLGDKVLTIENCDASQRDMRAWLQRRLDNETRASGDLAQQIVVKMTDYKSKYPLETREVDADIEAAAEFEAMLDTRQRDDLPRHENTFKTMLNEGTINDIALFQNQLDKERREILDKIDTINNSLRAIDYNPGSYIELISDRSQDQETRQFQQDLRACLGDTLAAGQTDLYNEHKFLQVKALIDRFNGREGLAEIDKRWTHNVTDVRNWFVFSASERWKHDGSEKEFYSDSAGKSGGQKEKLAYTILASALAYQFGLQWGEIRSHSLRFVMIDEAFGRGADEFARYGLELFRKLNLQLLIVTPLQKIHVIEDYVHSVHFVHNEDGQQSMIRNLTIEAYHQEKASYQPLLPVDAS